MYPAVVYPYLYYVQKPLEPALTCIMSRNLYNLLKPALCPGTYITCLNLYYAQEPIVPA